MLNKGPRHLPTTAAAYNGGPALTCTRTFTRSLWMGELVTYNSACLYYSYVHGYLKLVIIE